MVVDWLKTHWFILAAILAGGVAWGQNTAKVVELESRLSKAESIVEQQIRIEERTQSMQDTMKEQRQEMKEQKELLLQILIQQKAIANKVQNK